MELPDKLAYPDHLMFSHTSLDQAKPSIRLVKVLSRLSDTLLIQCEVVHAVIPSSSKYDRDYEDDTLALEQQAYEPAALPQTSEDDIECPPYVCLSYTWGDPVDERAVELNGKVFKVRKNLWAFLNMARNKFNDIHLWIDALCIDQANTTERNHQVQQMGNIYTRADTVLIWLGADEELEQILHTLDLANREGGMDLNGLVLHKLQGLSTVLPMSQNKENNVGSRSEVQGARSRQPRPAFASRVWLSLQDSTGKVEKLLEGITKHEYWSRAWVTQEVLLPKSTYLVAGTQTHDLFLLASRFRAAVPYFQDNAFENIVDILMLQAARRQQPEISWNDATGLWRWGVVNLLHRFRNKQCTIRRDRIYSLLALCKEGRSIQVDYEVPEENLLRQVLSLRPSSMCFCSASVLSHTLSPWDFTPCNDHVDSAPFIETHMSASIINSAICPSCSNWVPSSWTRRKGIVFCLSTVCPDTQGHLFREQPQAKESPDSYGENSLKSMGVVHVQARQNNRSQLLCEEGAGLNIKKTEWRHVYLLQFTFRTLVEMLREEYATSDLGLNSCESMWPKASNIPASGEGRLRFCKQPWRS